MLVSGSLLKRVGPDGNWESSFCELEGKSLRIYKNETKLEKELEFVVTPECECTPMQSENSFRFKLTVGGVSYYFDAGSEEQQGKWLKSLFPLVYPPTAPASMDDFEIISVLGRGFYGKVSLARHIKTGRLCAIKSVHKKELLEMDKIQTMLTELNILKKNKNPYIVRLLYAFQTPSKFYLVLEYAEGGDLFFHMANVGSLPIEEVRVYIAELILALEALHRNNVIYRDLKPENILFKSDGHICLADFGISKILDSEKSTTTTICGTAEYMAPEILQKKPYTTAVDWWQLGILMYEMIAEVTPFAEDDRSAMYRAIIHRSVSLYPIKDTDAREVIAALLRKNQKDRPTAERLKRFKFFSGLNWAAIETRTHEAPYVPVTEDEEGVAPPGLPNFDECFTSMAPMESYAVPVSEHYTDFEYVAPSLDERPF